MTTTGESLTGAAVRPTVVGMEAMVIDAFVNPQSSYPAADIRQFFRQFHELQTDSLEEAANQLWQNDSTKPQIESYHNVLDWCLDRMLGVPIDEAEADMLSRGYNFRNQFQPEMAWLSDPNRDQDQPPSLSSRWTRYKQSRAVLRHLDLSDQDVFYDLGAGYGRVTLYAGMTTEASCKGIEMLPPRVEAARQAIGKLALANAEMIEGNVLDQDFSDGTVFFMFSPFNPVTTRKVFDELRTIATDHPIRLVYWGSELSTRRPRWLQYQFAHKGYAFFASR